MTDPRTRYGASGDEPEPTIALFESQADAEHAIRELREAGFARDAIGVVLRDPSSRPTPLATPDMPLPGETTSAGALGGGILGGVVGLLAGVGALALPGLGPVIAGGVLATSLAGAGLGAAAGGVLGALVGLGIPDATARYFEEGVRQGSVLVVVDAGDRREAARDILRFSRGDLGAGRGELEAQGVEAWRGNERRYRDDLTYTGPERRSTKR